MKFSLRDLLWLVALFGTAVQKQRREKTKGTGPYIDEPRADFKLLEMPRTSRVAPGGYVYHVLNRGVGRRSLFDKTADFQAFEEILAQTCHRLPMRVCGFCLMPNHWHLVLWPERDGELAAFMQRLTITHVTRWQKHRGKVGEGHLYQGRYKSFPVEADDHFYQIMRYAERNGRKRGHFTFFSVFRGRDLEKSSKNFVTTS